MRTRRVSARGGAPQIGPIDQGVRRSISFAGSDHPALEAAAGVAPIAPDPWIDPKVLALAGDGAEAGAPFVAPSADAGPRPAAQPAFDETKRHMTYPRPLSLKMLVLPDEVVARSAAFGAPPAPAQGRRRPWSPPDR
jgi:hypothetical protein